MTNQEAYEKCRDKWEPGVVKTREAFAGFLGLDLPESNGPYDPDHLVATLILQGQKWAINEIAEKAQQNWRIKVAVQGESVVKLEDTELVEDDVPTRWKRITNAMLRARRQFEGLLALTTLGKYDRKILRTSVNLFDGVMITLQGAVHQLKGISPSVKQELLEIITPMANGEEDED